MSGTFWFFIAVVVVGIIATFIRGRKKMWCKVYFANNDVRLLYKTTRDYWFSGSKVVFRDEQGRVMVFPNNGRWILFYEEIPASEVGDVREQIAIENTRCKDEIAQAV